MSRLVDLHHVESGVPGLAIDGDRLRLTVHPVAGARIASLVHVASGVDLLWHNPRVPLRATYPGAAFDDVWSGGWDELFPTDPPGIVDGNAFHDHGDLWCGPWDCEVVADDGEEAVIALRRYAMSLPCLMEKRITVRRNALDVRFDHRLTNLGHQPVPYDWSLHVAHAIGPSSRVHLRTAHVLAVPEQGGRLAGTVGAVAWPSHDGIDLGAVLPATAGLTEWLHSAGRQDGWCAVTHPDRGVGLGLVFDPAVFRTTWLWGVYGGWRGHHVLLTEPSTSPPGGLARNVERGTAAVLAPHETLATSVVARILEDVADVPSDVPPPGLLSAPSL